MKILQVLIAATLATTVASAQTLTAILDDGTHIEVVSDSAIGSFLIKSEFGVLRSQGEQIRSLHDGSEEVRLLEPLRELDYEQWALRLGERGHLQRLLAEPLTAENEELLLEPLRIWGQRLDNLPVDTKREKRAGLLWEMVRKAEGPELALAVGALEVELSPVLGQNDRGLSLSKWRKAANHKDSAQRWAAARVAAAQQDPNAEIDLLNISLYDENIWVAMEAGRALYMTDPDGAAYRWAYEMIMSRKRVDQWRCATQLAEWSRADPKTARRVVKFMRGYSWLQQRRACQRSSATLLNGGSEITNNSVLEVASPSSLVMTHLADTIERVARSAEQSAPSPVELAEDASKSLRENAQAEAWRKLFTGR